MLQSEAKLQHLLKKMLQFGVEMQYYSINATFINILSHVLHLFYFKGMFGRGENYFPRK